MSGIRITDIEFMNRMAKLMDCMSEYMLKMQKLFSELCEKYDWGEELNGTVKDIEQLCHNFGELKKMIGQDNGDRT
jgi:hypothetical protein